MAFGDDTLVVNRTTKPLNFTWDGQPGELPPGYKVVENGVVPAGRDGQVVVTHLPVLVAEMARRQNVVKGTENPFDLHDVQYLVGVAVRDENTGVLSVAPNWPLNSIDYREQSDAIERLDRSMLPQQEGGQAHPIPAFGFPRQRVTAGGAEPFSAGPDAHFGILDSGGR